MRSSDRRWGRCRRDRAATSTARAAVSAEEALHLRAGPDQQGAGGRPDTPLPHDKAQKYINDDAKVQSGTMSSTRAFGRSSADWARRGNYVASAANFGRMMDSGVYEGGGCFFNAMNQGMQENIARKTGRWNPDLEE